MKLEIARLKPKIYFYFREYCHLCQDMWAQMVQAQLLERMELVARDIDEEDTWEEKYAMLIPALVTEDEQILSHYHLDLPKLNAYLRNFG